MASTTRDGDFEGLKLCEHRLAAQIALMYSTFSQYEESAALRVNQVSKAGKDLLVTFQKGKTYQHGEARRAVIVALPGILNPVNVILTYVHRLKLIQKEENGLLFPSVTSLSKGDGVLESAASYKAVLSQFKKAVIKAGVSVDALSYGLHSVRRGAVTSAANNGAWDHSIQKQMRVASGETVRRYASLDTVSLRAACSAVFM
jgi:site-specific recombinase XerD